MDTPPRAEQICRNHSKYGSKGGWEIGNSCLLAQVEACRVVAEIGRWLCPTMADSPESNNDVINPFKV